MEPEERLVQFLKENNAYEKYMENLRKEDRHDLQWLSRNAPYLHIGGAFFWAKTPEGADYWSEINKAWNNYKFNKQNQLTNGEK